MKKICMLATIHPVFDSRIYFKEALSLKKYGYDVHIVIYSNKTKDFISEDGIKIHTIKIKSNDKITTFIKKELLLKKALEIRADIYHYHDFYINFLTPKIKKELPKSKIIYDVHEFFIERNMASKNYWIRFFTKIMSKTEIKNLKYVDYIITAVDRIKERYLEYFSKDQIDTIYNYPIIDNDSKTENCEKIYDIVYNGGIKEDRGILELLEAIKIGKNRFPHIKLLLLGPINKDFKMKLAKKINSLGLQNNVVTLKVEHKEVKKYLCKSKIGINLLYPTYNNKYGLQIKIFEYMLSGLPIIANNLENNRKIISNSMAGEIVDTLSPQDIWNKIYKLLSDKSLYIKYSVNAKKAVLTEYNWNKMEEKLVNIYKSIM